MKQPLLVAIMSFTFIGCTDAPRTASPIEADLSEHGLRGVRGENPLHVDLLDVASSSMVGAIELGRDALEIELDGEHASLRWSNEAVATCNGESFILARSASGVGGSGWVIEEPSLIGSAFAACGRALAVLELVATTDGEMTLPWREASSDLGFGCQSVSTWVWGSSCRSCFASAADGVYCTSRTCVHDSGSCDSGTIYTSCSHTWCDR